MDVVFFHTTHVLVLSTWTINYRR